MKMFLKLMLALSMMFPTASRATVFGSVRGVVHDPDHPRWKGRAWLSSRKMGTIRWPWRRTSMEPSKRRGFRWGPAWSP